MSLRVNKDTMTVISFPRVSGDEPKPGRERVTDLAFSPRERG